MMVVVHQTQSPQQVCGTVILGHGLDSSRSVVKTEQSNTLQCEQIDQILLCPISIKGAAQFVLL